MENTVLVGIITQTQGASKSKEYLDELDFLTITAGGKVVKRFVQKLNMPNPKTFIGSGKISEIKNYIVENNVSTVILMMNFLQLKREILVKYLIARFLTEQI